MQLTHPRPGLAEGGPRFTISQARHKDLQGLQPGKLQQLINPHEPISCVLPLPGKCQQALPPPGALLQKKVVPSAKQHLKGVASAKRVSPQSLALEYCAHMVGSPDTHVGNPDCPMDILSDMMSSSDIIFSCSISLDPLQWGVNLLW